MTDKDSGKTRQNKGFLDSAFQAGISAAEDIHKRAFEIPLSMLEGMGAPEDKINMLREKSETLIGELYSAINSTASQIMSMAPGGNTDKSKDN